MNIFQKQKYGIITFLLLINVILSTTSIIYEDYWYVFLMILALSTSMNAIYSILLISNMIYNYYKTRNNTTYTINNNYNDINLAIVVPCYNETINELNCTFESIYNQKNLDNNKIMFVICDGTNETSNNLLKIFKSSIIENYEINNAYKTWDNIFEPLDIYCGRRNNINFMILIKKKNKGKRDSLTLIRRLLFYYNRKTEYNINIQSDIYKYINKTFLNVFISTLNKFLITREQNNNNIIEIILNDDNCSNNSEDITNKDNYILNICDLKDIDNKIKYIYGTDADTEIDENCIKNLLIDLENSDNTTVASVGFVDLYMKDTYFNIFKLYQFAEYYTAQLLRRHFQSTFTKKVNCLSGCNQLIKICDETCGEKILEVFNKKPYEKDNLFRQILSSASEDRNHITHMFNLFPYVKTIQTLNAKVYTKVPLNINKILSQRKRWNLGTFTNDTLILLNKNHNIIERFHSFINILINSLSPFIFIATVVFIKNIIINPSILMLYLSLIIFIPITYHLLTPFTKYRNNINKTLYYYLSYIFYLAFGPIINIILHIYTVLKLDDFNWNIYKK
jgi:chitin synthase